MQRYAATRTKNTVGMGIMLGSGEATTKLGPAYMARGFHRISSASMSSLPVLLLSPSSSSGSVCGGQRFLCTSSQRSADDARLIVHVLLTREDDVPDDDEAGTGIAAFLRASHLSTQSARLGLGGGGDAALLRRSETWDEDAAARPALLLLTMAGNGERRRPGEAEDAGRGRWPAAWPCARPTSRRSRRGWAWRPRAAFGVGGWWRRARTALGARAAAASSTWAGSGAAPAELRECGQPGSPWWIEDDVQRRT